MSEPPVKYDLLDRQDDQYPPGQGPNPVQTTSRRFHQKSRNGCSQCKKRRVKCDEAHPVCRNCQRTQATCSYLSNSAPAASPASSSKSHASSPSSGLNNALPVSLRTDNPSGFDLLDLRLMHHYTLVVSLILFPKGQGSTIWQRTIPMAAQSEPMLMHGMLAISAAHSTLVQGADHRIRALHHQNLGLLYYRAAIGSISKDNATNAFVFAIMLGVITFALPRLTEKALNLRDCLDLFTLMRGSKIVWELENHLIMSSDMAGLIPGPDWKYDDLEDDVEARLDELRRLSPIEDDVVWSAGVANLRLCLQVATARPDDLLAAPRWSVTLEEAMWVRFKAHEPVGLVLLAYYSLVLSTYQQIWWRQDWSDGLIKAVDSALSPENQVALGWFDKMEFLMAYSERMKSRTMEDKDSWQR